MNPQMLLTTTLLINLLAPLPPAEPRQMRERDLAGVVITMKRDECYGPCPIYSVTIHGDGTVIYKGVKYVKVSGRRTFRIPKEKVRELVREFYKVEFLSMKDSYTALDKGNGIYEEASDLSGTTTSITIGGKTKRVYNYYGGPTALDDLEGKIDSISGVAKYVRRA